MAVALADGELEAVAPRWTTGTPQASGQWYQLDMGTTQAFNQIILDADGSSNDYPRAYQVYVSGDGNTWTGPIASAVETGS